MSPRRAAPARRKPAKPAKPAKSAPSRRPPARAERDSIRIEPVAEKIPEGDDNLRDRADAFQRRRRSS